MTFHITEPIRIAMNEHGYTFLVARLGGRWVGYAAAKLAGGNVALFIFPEVCEDVHLGVADRDYAIRLTGAIAQDPEHAYGGVAAWFIPPELRGQPNDFRCEHCSRVGCHGACQDDADFINDGP